MSPNDGAIEDQVFHIRIVGKVLMHLLPDPVVTPTGKAFVDAIPVTVLFWQQPPLRPTAGHPKHPFNETTTGGFLTDISSGALPQKVKDFVPLFIFYFYT